MGNHDQLTILIYDFSPVLFFCPLLHTHNNPCYLFLSSHFTFFLFILCNFCMFLEPCTICYVNFFYFYCMCVITSLAAILCFHGDLVAFLCHVCCVLYCEFNVVVLFPSVRPSVWLLPADFLRQHHYQPHAAMNIPAPRGRYVSSSTPTNRDGVFEYSPSSPSYGEFYPIRSLLLPYTYSWLPSWWSAKLKKVVCVEFKRVAR